MQTKVVLLVLVALLLTIGIASAATVQVNVTAKELVFDDGKFYGVITTNETTIGTYVTGEPASLGKTLSLMNQMKIGINNVTASNGIISGWIS
jgi:hypothetical protein